MKSLRLLSLCLIGSALTLAACDKNEDPNTTAADSSDDPTETSGNTDFADNDDGEEEDEGMTTNFVPDDDDLTGVSSCDAWLQDCPDDEKCVAYASAGGTWDANRCVTI